jgi:hypothetical protein
MHILIDNAKRFRKGSNSSFLKDFNYDIQEGYWKSLEGQSLINSNNALVPITKKNDIETGEDRKGE